MIAKRYLVARQTIMCSHVGIIAARVIIVNWNARTRLRTIFIGARGGELCVQYGLQYGTDKDCAKNELTSCMDVKTICYTKNCHKSQQLHCEHAYAATTAAASPAMILMISGTNP